MSRSELDVKKLAGCQAVRRGINPVASTNARMVQIYWKPFDQGHLKRRQAANIRRKLREQICILNGFE